MALETSRLVQGLKKLQDDLSKMTDSEKAKTAYAEGMAKLLEDFIKSAEVQFKSGTVTGTCPSGGGPLTAGQATKGEIK